MKKKEKTKYIGQR